MIEIILETSKRLIDAVPRDIHRFLFDAFSMEERLSGLVGPRGVGKTTLLLQYLREKHGATGESVYASADHIFFNRTGLLEFVRELHLHDGTRFFVFDEVHKYSGWEQELKNIYDSFPEVHVAFSGSSSLALQRGRHDLSRRAIMSRLPGLSFREFLNFRTGSAHASIKFEDLLGNSSGISGEVARIPRVAGHFRDYMASGYYPFFLEGGGHFFEKLRAVVEKSIHEDITANYSLRTESLPNFKRILAFLATIPPGGVNIHKMATNLGIDDKTVAHYLEILQETGLVRPISEGVRGHGVLRRNGKVYLDNTSLMNAVCEGLGQEVDLGTMRELFFVQSAENAGLKVELSGKGGDFFIGENLFEVGGVNKRRGQLPATGGKEFVVKDGILVGGRGTIPLHLFGFLY